MTRTSNVLQRAASDNVSSGIGAGYTSIPGTNSLLTSTQSQVDGLVSGFIHQASDPVTLGAMMAGGVFYRVGKIGALTVAPTALQRIPGVLPLVSSAVGLTAEVTAFRGVIHGHASLSGQGLPESFLSARGFGRDAINFGILKLTGRAFLGQNSVLVHATQAGSMVLGHNLAWGL